MNLEKIEKEMMGLNPLFSQNIIANLLKKGRISIPQIIAIYTNYLEEENNKKGNIINSLWLNLGVYAMEDNSPRGKGIRRYLYNEGLFNEGSEFGEMLKKEFKNETL